MYLDLGAAYAAESQHLHINTHTIYGPMVEPHRPNHTFHENTIATLLMVFHIYIYTLTHGSWVMIVNVAWKQFLIRFFQCLRAWVGLYMSMDSMRRRVVFGDV